jgi:glycosyltransferase involved in cell wall biosynthesis
LMKILGLMMIRNGESTVEEALDRMAEYCDAVFVLDDRSRDRSAEIAKRHRVVDNVFAANRDLSQEDWFFPESQNLNLLYRMADFYQPDWVTRVDVDEYVSPGNLVRDALSGVGSEFAGVQFTRASTWDDPRYPLMIPLMGSGRYPGAAFWRYYPGLKAEKPLHNPRMPHAVRRHGLIGEVPNLTLFHSGWNTLERRIERVELYAKHDPDCRLSFGKTYDKLLLFGHARDDVDRLINTYGRRFERYQRGRFAN